jgi:hypothetical protein
MARKRQRTTYRPAVPAATKRILYGEAGNKCANPGCPHRLVELHHIREWHVYQTHDAKHMIAICPTCHNYAHHGELRIDEHTIRSWKKIVRNPYNRGYLYIEPGPNPRVLLGSIFLTRRQGGGLVIFDFGDSTKLSFRVLAGNVLLVSMKLTSPDGRLIVEVRDNHLEHALAPGVIYQARPGRHRVTVPSTGGYVPQPILDAYLAETAHEPIVHDGQITILDLSVVDPGTVKAEGVWATADRAAIVTPHEFAIWKAPGFVLFRGVDDRGEPTDDLLKLPTVDHVGPIGFDVLSDFAGLT